jgi:hypothetical protein
MSLRAQLEAFPPDTLLLLLTTLGTVYVGTIVDIEDEALRIAGPQGTETIVLNLGDVSGVRAHEEEV